jgi:hypothetical protein
VDLACRQSLVVGLLIGAIAGCGAAPEPPSACSPLEPGSIVESADFTPWEERLTHSPPRPMSVAGRVPNLDAGDAAVPFGTIDGMPLQDVSRNGFGGVYQFFWDRPIAGGITLSAFTAGGGIRYTRLATNARVDLIEEAARELGPRATRVDVGPHRGLLTWADPDENGLRPHHLQWSDGRYVHMLVANRPPEYIVNLGRGLACGL